MAGEVKALNLPGKATRIGWQLPKGMDFDEWLRCGQALDQVEGAVQWWRGDWWAFGEGRKWGDGEELAAKAGVNYASARQYGSVARAYDLFTRVNKLTFDHHRMAMAVEPKERGKWLLQAEEEGWSAAELRRNIKQHKNRFPLMSGLNGACCGFDELHELVRRGVKFGNIYVDPPWLYDNQGTRAATGNHYEGLTVDQLCDPELMPVANLAAQDSHLHLWTTNAFMFECSRIFDAWGFEFRSSLIWAKTEMGIGNYWRNSHEVMLTAVRGDAKRFDRKNLRSWFECSRGQHSVKPDQVRDWIAEASPTPRLELFGRSEHDGWLTWGDQIEKDLFSRGVRKLFEAVNG